LSQNLFVSRVLASKFSQFVESEFGSKLTVRTRDPRHVSVPKYDYGKPPFVATAVLLYEKRRQDGWLSAKDWSTSVSK
jgi:hypothetical protein